MARGCAFTVFWAVGVVFALLLGGLWYINEQLKPGDPPDVAAFADSAAARSARAGAARAASADLGALTSALPWAEPLGTSVSDDCRSDESGGSIGSRSSWSAVTCLRSTVAYVAFDGDIGSRLRALDSALATQGWRGGTLTAAAASAYRTALPPSPSAASSSPGVTPTGWGRISVSYGRSPGPAGVFGPAPRLQVSVAGAPYDPRADTRDFQLFGSRPQLDPGGKIVHVTWQPLPANAVAGSAVAAHGYVAAFSLVSRYIDASSPEPTASTTSPTPTLWDPGPCLSGSHKCF